MCAKEELTQSLWEVFDFGAKQEIVLVMIVYDIVDYFPAEIVVEVMVSVFDLCHGLFRALVRVLVLFHAHVLVLVNATVILIGSGNANVAVDCDFCFLI